MVETLTISILGFEVYSGEKKYFIEKLTGVINTISPHSYIVARKDDLFQKALKSSDILLPDGVGIVVAARILCKKKITKIAGSDLHKMTLLGLSTRCGSCFYLGSSEATLKLIKKKLAIEYPALKVGSLSPPYKTLFSEDDNSSMINVINEFNPDVLFVGMTAPKQEKWVFANRHLINAPIICSIGAVFDFYAGTVRRPGKFWISLGLEWLPRLFREPSRLWRRTFISTPLFIWYVLIEKLRIGNIH